MDQKSKSNCSFLEKLREYEAQGVITERVAHDAHTFYTSYSKALTGVGQSIAPHEWVFCDYLDLLKMQEDKPFPFEPFHKKVVEPYNYFSFGLEFFRPLVDIEHSKIVGKNHLQKISKQMEAGENVIFFANHQIEADPQAVSLLTEKDFPQIANEIIFVAGERVLTDSIAAPFSMGRNLLCIYSKRHIDNEPAKKSEKQTHNSKTMRIMGELLSEGGKCIYVAPSGGRDRPDSNGNIQVAPFDPASVEMFYLIARKAKRPTHFYPLALATYNLLPPPDTVRKQLGEERITNYGPLHMAVGEEIEMEKIPGLDIEDKQLRRKIRAEYIYKCVYEDYNQLT